MESNTNYHFKFGGVKFSVDISTAKRKGVEQSDTIIHYHAKHELLFVGDEELSVLTEGGTKSFRCCIVSIPPFLKHHTNRTHYFRILFSFEINEQKPSAFSGFIGSFFAVKGVSVLNISDKTDLYVSRLSELLSSTDDSGTEAAAALLSLLFYDVYLSNHTPRSEKKSSKESYLILIERFINGATLEPHSDTSLAALAKSLHLSKKQSSRIIYKYFAKPLSTLIAEKRLTEAARLLTYTNLSISDIASEVGFSSENYFYRQFKLAYGKTPLAYRKGASLT